MFKIIVMILCAFLLWGYPIYKGYVETKNAQVDLNLTK